MLLPACSPMRILTTPQHGQFRGLLSFMYALQHIWPRWAHLTPSESLRQFQVRDGFRHATFVSRLGATAFDRVDIICDPCVPSDSHVV